MVKLGNLDAAIRCYQESLAQKHVTVEERLAIAHYYQELAELHQKKGELGEALGCLRMSLSKLEENKVDIEEIGAIRSIEALQQKRGTQEEALSRGKKALNVAQKLAWHRRVRLISPDKKWWGMLLALAVGWVLWQLPPPAPLHENGMHFLATLASATILWLIDVFDEYVVTLGLLLVWVLTATASPEEALSGFSRPSWFFVLGVLGMGAAVSQSGLLYRVALNMLRRVPPYYNLYTFTLSTLGLAVTPLIPNNKARLAIIIPISQAISETFGFKPRSKASAGLTLSAFVGFSQMSFVFLTGANVCLIGWNLLPPQAKAEFAWGSWFLAAFPAGLFTLFFLSASIHILFRPEEHNESRYSPTTLRNQIEILGPLTYAEQLSLTVLALALLGWLGQPILGVDEAWVALAAFVFFLLAGVLDKSAVKNSIDWGYLLFTGVITGMAGIMTRLSIDRWLIALMGPILSSVTSSPLLFLISVILLVYLVRFFLNKTPATILLTVAIVPWSEPTGIHPGVILLTILMGLECWFLVFQTDSYQIAYYITDEKGFTHAQARKLMVAKFISSLIAVAISVSYWRTLGLIH